MGRLLWRDNDFKTALAWIDKARALEPNYWEADFWKARCLKSLGRTEESFFVLRHLRQRHEEFLAGPHAPVQSPYEAAILGYSEEAVQKLLGVQ